jgi:SHS2 domain-containing protein
MVPHTADAGIRAVAADLPTLFEEAAAALAELTTDHDLGLAPSIWRPIVIRADDLGALAFAWLNELVSLADVHRAAIVVASVDRLEQRPGRPGSSRGEGRARAPLPTEAQGSGTWRLAGRLGLHPFGALGVRPRCQVKSATYHGLSIERTEAGWVMQAVLDV